MDVATKKARGAYYTNPAVAAFLSRWALRSPEDRVLDPCFGAGVFLQAASERISSLGGDPSSSITGIEVDPGVHQATTRVLSGGGVISGGRLLCHDFFDLDPSTTGRFTAVIGNPPFIRYQRFNGIRRSAALRRASQAGVQLRALTSAWAPFIAHATSFLEERGRLAVVAPAELCHAVYARPLLALLRGKFRRAWILTFERRLFPEINEDTVLILGEEYGRRGGDLRVVALPDVSALCAGEATMPKGTLIEDESLGKGPPRFVSYLLPEPVRDFYQRLASHPSVTRLGAVATVGIGYVTGDNEFFHLSAAETRRRHFPPGILKTAVRRGNWLRGLAFRRADWNALDREGRKTRLLDLTGRRGALPAPVEEYLKEGRKRGVHLAYKCRVRDPWYAVPQVTVPDLFLTYMANDRPLVAVNLAKAVAPNTLLHVRLNPLGTITAKGLAVSWWNSLAALSAEVEGHSLGGGMLKLEPREAANVMVPDPVKTLAARKLPALWREMESLVRSRRHAQAMDLGDREILQHGLGLSVDECRLLREGYNTLLDRRQER